MGGLEPHGQGPEAALCGSTERLTALQEDLIEVEADICLQALWETLQDLRVKHGLKQDMIMVRCDVEVLFLKAVTALICRDL